MAQNYKTKERVVSSEVMKFVEAQRVTALFDKQIPGGSSRRRPDVSIDCKTHCIIIECDENGHNTEDYCECEDRRIMVTLLPLSSSKRC